MAKSLNQVIPAILEPCLKKRGLSQALIILDWSKIVGPELAKRCQASKVTYPKGMRTQGTLHLTVLPSWAPILEQQKHQLIDRVNSYFGYAAVSQIRLLQNPVWTP